MNKRGVYFFIIDVIIGVLIFLSTVLVISSFFVPRPSLGGINQNLDMLTEDFFTIRIGDLSDEMSANIPSNYKNRKDLTLDELIYLLRQEVGYEDNINRIIEDVSFWLPKQFGFSYSVLKGSDVLYSRNTSLGVDFKSSSVVVSRMKVTSITTLNSTLDPTVTEVSVWR